MDELEDFYVHTCTVETFQGTNGYGQDLFATAATLAPTTTPASGCFIEQKRRLVRNKDGVEVISETTLYTYPTAAALFTPDSRVTIGGNVSRVIVSNLNDSGPLGLPDHVAVNLE